MGLLRFLLAISVVIVHSSPIIGFKLVGGELAVRAFYIISGFYMALILKEKYIGINNSYKLFLSNRFLRLYPVYWLVLILTILWSGILAINSHGKIWGSFYGYVHYFHQIHPASFIFLILTNIFFFFQDTVMFLGLHTSSGNLFFTTNFHETRPMLYKFLFIPQAWTIGLELTFYLMAPLLVKLKVKVIVSIILFSLMLRFLLIQMGLKNDPWSYRFFPTELVFFLLGIMSYHLKCKAETMLIKVFQLKIIFVFICLFTAIHCVF